MPADWTWKQGDSAPAITDTLQNLDLSNPDLTGASVTLTIRALGSPIPITVTGTITVLTAKTGLVSYKPSAQDTAAAGTYMATWQVAFLDGTRATYPPRGYRSIAIEESLSGEAQQLVSLPEVKDHLHIPPQDHVHDSQLLHHIEAVTSLIENIVGPVIPRSFDEWHAGGQYFIRLRRRPSSALGSDPILTLMGVEEYRGPTRYPLTIVGDPTQASTYSVMLDPPTATIYRRSTGGGVIAFGAGAFGGGMPCQVHVSYQAGQRSIPANIRRAAIEAIRVNYQTTMAVGRGSRTRSDETDVGPPLGFYLPRRCLELLAPNRRHPTIA